MLFYYEKNSDPKIFHLIYANQYSEAGKYYNGYTLQFIENLFDDIEVSHNLKFVSNVGEFCNFSISFVKISIFSNNSCLISKIVVPLQPKRLNFKRITKK